MNNNILLCGVGGQGTVLASKLLSAAAMSMGERVLAAETIGMAQRGGSVTSHVRIGKEAYSPLIARAQADIIIAFEPGEAVRALPYLKKGGTVVLNTRPVRPVMGTLAGNTYDGSEMLDYIKSKDIKVIALDGEAACEALGSSRVLNVVLLGAAVRSGALDITADMIKKAIVKKINPKFHELNLRAIDYALYMR